MKGTNCPNCGAPLNRGKCDYCGTQTQTENGVFMSTIEISADTIKLVAKENYNRCRIERGCYS